MTRDFFERLADVEVPPPPQAFKETLHQRLNSSLVMLQLFDLLVRGMPWAMLQFARSLGYWLRLTLAGPAGTEPNRGRPESRRP